MALHALEIIYFPLPVIIGQPLGTFSVLASLFLLEKLTGKEITLEETFKKIRFKGTNKLWLVLSPLVLPLFTLFGSFLDFLMGWQKEFLIIQPEVLETLGIATVVLIPVTLFAGLLSSPILEEPGWRGFAIERLQAKHGHLLGSLILGSLWWLWHQPINIANGIPVTFYSYLSMVVTSFAIDTVFFLSDNNLLSAMLMHSSLIVTFSYIYSNQNSLGILIIGIIITGFLRLYYHEKVRKKTEMSRQPSLN
ncbi:MAG: type II CAAX prenyl endopeptidase Rce1 family protein [Candidatus Odinarchaeota archaeon]